MTREWKPGDVALVNDTTNPDAPWLPATCREAAVKGEHEAVWVLHRSGARVWGSVSQARPLVVIDPEDREQVERLTATMKSNGWSGIDDEAASDMQRVLREFANPTPPKPDEPTLDGALIECDYDGHRGRAVLLGDSWTFYGDALRDHCPSWEDFKNVRVLSEGVKEGDR